MYSNPSWNLNSESWYSLLLALVRYLFATVHVGVTASGATRHQDQLSHGAARGGAAQGRSSLTNRVHADEPYCKKTPGSCD